MGSEFALTTAMLWGIEARPVRVEVSMSAGLPGMSIVGRPDASVIEARSRVRCAIRAAGFKMPRQNITVNLAPSEQRKSGTAFDLPIAIAILAASEQIPLEGLDHCLVVGELSLDGRVEAIRGLVAYADLARRLGLQLIAPMGALEGCGDVDVRFVAELAQFARPISLVGECRKPPPCTPFQEIAEHDFSEVAGQDIAKRALSIAVAGNLGILLLGPPGVGKTMLAGCVPGILPAISEQDYFETALVHSVAGSDDPRIAAHLRPFRCPHHTIGTAGLLGGGRPVRPGELSLAHNGVLFLDELGEYNRAVLQAMRQPMEEHVVRVTRVDGTYTFPCRFQLVAASNPCPCGHLGDPAQPCTCSATSVMTYRAKLTGPLIDRIDLVVPLERPKVSEIMGQTSSVTTAMLKEQVTVARAYAQWRSDQTHETDGSTALPKGRVARAVAESAVSTSAQTLLESLLQAGTFSVRAMVSIIRCARVIADMEESAQVCDEHLLEAVGYRDREVAT